MYVKYILDLCMRGILVVLPPGLACHTKVIKGLMNDFKTPADAESYYSSRPQPITQPRTITVAVQTDVTSLPNHIALSSTLGDTHQVCKATQTDINREIADTCMFSCLSRDDQLKELSSLFSAYFLVTFSVTVLNDFLSLSSKAMAQLKHNYRSNVLYNMAKCMGTLRRDGGDSRFPMRRMPMGLVEHIANFFVTEDMQKVSIINKRTKGISALLVHCNSVRKYSQTLVHVNVKLSGSFLSNGPPIMATNYVLPIWSKVVKVAPWTNVERCFISSD